MIDFTDALPSIVIDTTDAHYARDPETFYASQLGFCRRQLYVAKLGLKDTTALQGRFQVGTLIQQYFGEQLSDRYPRLDLEAKMAFDVGAVKFVGRCDCYDPVEEIVYDIKTRSNWYSFHPPIDRHLDQLHVYMRGLNVESGQLVYVSKTDLADVRTWPPSSTESAVVHFDPDRFEAIVAKAEAIRDEIIANGIATTPDEIPFATCDCYLCETEELQLPDQTNSDGTSQGVSGDARSHQPESEEEAEDIVGADRAVTPAGNGDDTSIAENKSQVIESDTYHIPTGLREFDIWVVWDCREKFARAPWQEGTMYPCEWAADKPVDPRRSFEKAKMVADLPVSEIHASWPFPDGDDLPATVEPAVLLPHDPPEPPIVFVDFDDVRDPDTGLVSGEVSELIALLDGYTELSRSETGIHVYVRGRLPDGFGRFIAPLTDSGQIEIYDHARFTGGTWRHVEGTPLDEIPEAQEAIDQIIATYATEAQKQRLSRPQTW